MVEGISKRNTYVVTSEANINEDHDVIMMGRGDATVAIQICVLIISRVKIKARNLSLPVLARKKNYKSINSVYETDILSCELIFTTAVRKNPCSKI